MVGPWPVSGGLRVVLDESACIIIEQDRVHPSCHVERFTVTNVEALVLALYEAQRAQGRCA
jgi:hypothetical protein